MKRIDAIVFSNAESGYALVLTLLFMPVFIGKSLLSSTYKQGQPHARPDLQAAADALGTGWKRANWTAGSPPS